MQHGTGGPGPEVEVGSQTLGEGEHKLSHRDVGEDVVHHMGGGLGHGAGPARRTGTPSATRIQPPASRGARSCVSTSRRANGWG